MLTLSHVSKSYGKFPAVEDISLEMEHGLYGMLAPNGKDNSHKNDCNLAGSYTGRNFMGWDSCCKTRGKIPGSAGVSAAAVWILQKQHTRAVSGLSGST